MQVAICLLFIVHYSGYALKNERVNKTFSTLLLTPLGARRILLQKTLGILQFLIPHFVFIIITMLIAPMTTYEFIVKNIDKYPSYLLVFPLTVLGATIAQFIQIKGIMTLRYLAALISLLVLIAALIVYREIDKMTFWDLAHITPLILLKAFLIFEWNVKSLDYEPPT